MSYECFSILFDAFLLGPFPAITAVGKCWKSQLFEGRLQVFISYQVKWKQSVCSINFLYSSTLYSLFLLFFVLEIFKFKYIWQVICQTFSFLSKFKWFKGIVKWAESCKCVILLVSRMVWHKRINFSLKEWGFWYLILTSNFLP